MKLINYTTKFALQIALAATMVMCGWEVVGAIYFAWVTFVAFMLCWQPDPEAEKGTEV